MRTTTNLLPILVLAPFLSLNGQDVLSDFKPAFDKIIDSLCQSGANCGKIIIACKQPEMLTHLEIKGSEAHLNFKWKNADPTDRFPMNLSLKTGKVKVRYKMKGKREKVLKLDLGREKNIDLTLE